MRERLFWPMTILGSAKEPPLLDLFNNAWGIPRDALASDLRAIGCEVRVQEDFQAGSLAPPGVPEHRT